MDSYIGQTIFTLEKRWEEHCREYSQCRYLRNAIQKYGSENFEIKIISKCNSLEEMNHREKYYIKLFKTLAPHGYNLKEGGDSSLLSEISRKNI